MRAFRMIPYLLCVTALAGCVTAGNPHLRSQTPDNIQREITNGATTQAQIRAALGEPTEKTFTDSGNEMWTFRYVRLTPRARTFIPVVNLFSRVADVRTKDLVVLFDKNGVVSKYDLREVQSVVREGIAE